MASPRCLQGGGPAHELTASAPCGAKQLVWGAALPHAEMRPYQCRGEGRWHTELATSFDR